MAAPMNHGRRRSSEHQRTNTKARMTDDPEGASTGDRDVAKSCLSSLWIADGSAYLAPMVSQVSRRALISAHPTAAVLF
jgi:hypothetical protein